MFGIPPVRLLVQDFFDKYLMGKAVTVELLPDSVVTLRKLVIPTTQKQSS
jgi:hypothetical protein